MRLLVILLATATANAEFADLSDSQDWKSLYPKTTIGNADLLVPKLIAKYKYPVESHTITTTDGYQLVVHRIPYGLKGSSKNRPVVFLQHSLLCSSADWIITGPKKGLAYLLADRGFDVWMGNARGNRYSRANVYCDVKSKQFWDFSWHEIGTIDLPAMIDLVLKHTKEKALFYIGHSQGTTAFYVMATEKPEYNAKIRAQFSLAPIAYMNHMTSPLLRVISPSAESLKLLLNLIGFHEFLPTDGFLHNIAQAFCKKGLFQVLCTNALFLICGFNEAQFNSTLLPIVMGHTPAGSSTKQLLHYAQEINSGQFCQYDYGFVENLKRYDSIFPPKYNLSKISAPVYLFYSHNDWLAAEIDVCKLYDELGNVQEKFLIADAKWNHLDFLYGIDAGTMVYNQVFKLLSKH